MAHEQILESLRPGRLEKAFPGHDGKGADMRTTELGIMIVMVVVRASPNAARAERENSKNPHQTLRQP